MFLSRFAVFATAPLNVSIGLKHEQKDSVAWSDGVFLLFFIPTHLHAIYMLRADRPMETTLSTTGVWK
jgi:hypothetical protein